MANTSVLVVEDDRAIADVLEYSLQRAGYLVSRAHDGQSGLEQAQLKLPEIIILDIMLPIMDGLEVCKQLRNNPETRNAVIIMLTAKSEETDQLVGFSAGADDYVVKPFSVRVLVERIKALQRRKTKTTDSINDTISLHDIHIDRRRHVVKLGEETIELTKSEFGLLNTLIRQPGRVFDRSELIDAALGGDTLVLDRTIDVHIRALRKKLGDSSDVIETVRGVGYRFKEAESV